MFKVHIRHHDFGNEVEVYFVEERDGEVTAAAKPVKIVFESIDLNNPDRQIEPTFVIGRGFAQNFLKSWVEAITKEGIKPEADSKLEGKIEAISYHLEDLRKLLKL